MKQASPYGCHDVMMDVMIISEARSSHDFQVIPMAPGSFLNLNNQSATKIYIYIFINHVYE